MCRWLLGTRQGTERRRFALFRSPQGPSVLASCRVMRGTPGIIAITRPAVLPSWRVYGTIVLGPQQFGRHRPRTIAARFLPILLPRGWIILSIFYLYLVDIFIEEHCVWHYNCRFLFDSFDHKILFIIFIYYIIYLNFTFNISTKRTVLFNQYIESNW